MSALPVTPGRRLVILDRDGTINVDRPNYVRSPEEVTLLPGAADGIRRLQAIGLRIAVVTNQSGIGRGLFDAAMVDVIHDRLSRLLAAEGAAVDAFYVCPHAPAEGCGCRKPAIRLLRNAARDFEADLRLSFLVGDKGSDIEAGRMAEMTTVLVRTGLTEPTFAPGTGPDLIASGLLAAASLIEARLLASR